MYPIVLLLLVLLTAGASAIEKNIAHPAPTETSIVSDAVLDKIIASPLSSPSSYPEDGKVQEMMQEYTTLMTDFDAASHNHVEHTNKILDVAEITDVFAKKHRQEKEELTKVVKAKREEARIKIHTFAMEVYATMEEEIQEEKDRLESEEARLTAQTTLLQDHVKTWDTTQETLNKYEEKKQTLAKRMLVTLKKDKQAKKQVFNAADESSNDAPASAKDTGSRRLRIKTRQMLDDAIYNLMDEGLLSKNLVVLRKKPTLGLFIKSVEKDDSIFMTKKRATQFIRPARNGRRLLCWPAECWEEGKELAKRVAKYVAELFCILLFI